MTAVFTYTYAMPVLFHDPPMQPDTRPLRGALMLKRNKVYYDIQKDVEVEKLFYPALIISVVFMNRSFLIIIIIIFIIIVTVFIYVLLWYKMQI